MNAITNKKVIVRIMGGLGNQLFCYAAARRLASVNNAELVLDDVTGFARDHHGRQYVLDHFNISARKATPVERLEPFERYRRGIAKILSRRKTFNQRVYLEQEMAYFDVRLLNFQVKGTLYMDGLWQSEDYFKDIEQIIQRDLEITPPMDNLNHEMAREIVNSNAVALHVRWFDAPGSTAYHNVSDEYYQRAIALMESKIDSPRYFLFSDDPVAAIEKLALPEERVVLVSHNKGDKNAYADLWLMQKCKYFIMPRSTFSWWGAWLCHHPNKLVIMPNFTPKGAPVWASMGMIFKGCTQIT
ncbi:alpha-1,2-fucosyltransferase [Desulfobacula sp.]|uniref:alpha-1,2-fucosyltransferase n=1 Tax=Desulfobacula sp. TaxID=2593537 RepID=UPI001EC0888D|nr:alpha-1,2-fucosyltransferase [Desulfobacula sp.]